MKKLSDIIWISTQDWEDVWTRKQRFAQMFARAGHRVLYLENQLHWAGYLRSRQLRQRARLTSFLAKPRQVEENLYVVTPPIVLPGQMVSPTVNRINKLLVSSQLARLAKTYGFSSPILWLYPPDSVELAGRLNESAVVFDCVDDWSRFKGLVSQATMQSYMHRLYQRADMVIVTHENLYTQASQFSNNVELVPNGVEPGHFAKALQEDTSVPDDIRDISTPIVGFIGNIIYWLDFELIRHLALERPAYSFVFIGPVASQSDVSILSELPNVHFLGYRPYANLPNYLKAFDVCINPFKVDALSASVDPLKVYEYLAAGKPVVSVDMPAMSRFGGAVFTATDRSMFLELLDNAINNSRDVSLIAKRVSCASQHSWENRFDQVSTGLHRMIVGKQTAAPN
jgi:glycosyltransferase involved in cell wall biosynthesis